MCALPLRVLIEEQHAKIEPAIKSSSRNAADTPTVKHAKRGMTMPADHSNRRHSPKDYAVWEIHPVTKIEAIPKLKLVVGTFFRHNLGS